MKFKKLLAGVCSMAIAASMMAVSASAAEPQTSGLEYPSYAPLTLDGRDPAEIGPKTLNFDLFAFEGIESDLVSVDVTIAPADESIGNIWGNGWSGGNIALGYNAYVDGAESTSWVQPVFAPDGTDDISKAWGTVAGADGSGSDPLSFTYEIPENEKIPFAGEDDEGNIISGGVFQVSFWWGSASIVELQELTFNFADGSEIAVISTDATTPLPTAIEGEEEGDKPYANANYILTEDGIASIRNVTYKPAREAVAAEALKTLQDKLAALDVSDIVESTNAAAEALSASTDAIANIDNAIKGLAEYEAAVEEAQATIDGVLMEGDSYDEEALAAAKKTVADAKADLEAAKTALNEAIAKYDADTAKLLEDQQKEIEKLEEEKAALQAELDAAKKDAAANADKIKELEDQIAAKDEEIAAKDAEIEELKKNPPAVSGTENNGSSTGTSTGTGTGAGTGAGTDFQGKNPATGATAGLALAGLALAGVAVVATKKRK